MPILTLYQRHFELGESEVEVQVGAITISMARCYKRSIGESISSLDHRWLILSRFVCTAKKEVEISHITFDDVMCIPWGKRIVRYLPDPFSLE